MTPAEERAHARVREDVETRLGGGPAWTLGHAAEDYAAAVRDADPDASSGDVYAAVAEAVVRSAEDVLTDVRSDRVTAVAATFPAVSAYVSAALGLPVVVGWSDTADTDPEDVLGVAAVVVDGPAADAFAWADACAEEWPDVLAARLRDDVAAWT